MDEIYVIYADVLFLINFILDFLCLYTAGAIMSARMKLLRPVAAAVTGGIYSLATLYYSSAPIYISLPAHVAAALLMCFIAYGYGSFGTFMGRAAVFAVTAAFSGGVLSAVFALTGRYYTLNGGFYAEISPVFLIALAFISVGAAYVYALLCRKKTSFAAADAVVEKDGGIYKLTLLVDSGCFVIDPLTGKRVIIVSHSAFRGFTPRMPRYIPVKTAGGSSLLCGFQPDKLTVGRLGKPGKTKDAVIAVDMNTDNFSGYDGLIPPSLV